jgi:WD40 repeat protein
MNEVLAHPDAGQLTAFGLGQLDEAESAAVESHLAECIACRSVVESAADDSLVVLLRYAASPNEDTAQHGIEALSSTETPAVPGVPPELADHPRYRVQELLGVGGMGSVYRAEHQLMARPVALKVLNKALTDTPAGVERFRREARAAARLAHPNIVAGYDADQAGDFHFLVMEYVEGTSLARLLADKGRLPVALACDYVRQAALGLQHAHEQGMVHRDIKPHNLMLTPDGRVKILDFGLARFAVESAPAATAAAVEAASNTPTGSAPGPLTQLGTVIGTPDYIAPEQAADAHAADIRADIYSLGCTLYDLLAGRPPFPEETAVRKVLAHAQRQPQPLRELRKDVPPALARVVERMLAKDPAQRYQTPAEAARALAPFAGGSARRRGRLPLLVAAAVLLVALGLAACLYGPAVYRIATNRGQVVIEIDDPTLEVLVQQNDITVRDRAARREYHLRPGQNDLPAGDYDMEVRVEDSSGEVHLIAKQFTIKRGDKVPLKVTWEPEEGQGLRFPAAFPGEIRRFVGHQGSVKSVAFSPDGRLALSASGYPTPDNSARVWDVASGRELLSFTGHGGASVDAIACSPDGRLALSGGRDNTLCLWEVATGHELRRFRGHTSGIGSVAFSPDGQRAVSAGWDGTIRLWDVDTGQELKRFEGHTGAAQCAVFSRDGHRILSGSSDKTMRLWDVHTGLEVQRFQGATGIISGVALSPDGFRALSASADVCLWDVATGQVLRRFEGTNHHVESVAFSPDGRRVLAGGWDCKVHLWDMKSGRELASYAGHKDWVWSVAISSDGRLALSGSKDGTVRLWKLPGDAPAPTP